MYQLLECPARSPGLLLLNGALWFWATAGSLPAQTQERTGSQQDGREVAARQVEAREIAFAKTMADRVRGLRGRGGRLLRR